MDSFIRALGVAMARCSIASPVGAEPPEGCYYSDRVDVAVYMIWDTDILPSITYRLEDSPHLIEPALSPLDRSGPQ
ncbi:MAG: hypothetical protein ACLP0J_09805 [Solirubrobacteraceae bacterium]